MSQCCFEEILAQNERLEYINSVYVDIFMHMPQGAIIVNIEGKIKEVNLAAQDMMGQSLEENKWKPLEYWK
jgi:PAS domain-containing protein